MSDETSNSLGTTIVGAGFGLAMILLALATFKELLM